MRRPELPPALFQTMRVIKGRHLAAPHSFEIYIAAFFSCSSTTALTLPGK